jgi:hypothetical protein
VEQLGFSQAGLKDEPIEIAGADNCRSVFFPWQWGQLISISPSELEKTNSSKILLQEQHL